MHIYLVERVDPIGYDETDSAVIITADEMAVRRAAAAGAHDEGEGPWLDPARSTVTLLGAPVNPAPRTVLVSFNAG